MRLTTKASSPWLPPARSSTLPAAPPVTPGVYYTANRPALGTNGFAIASFVLGLLGGVLLSVIFGIAALAKLRERLQRGNGLAIAGLCLSGVWLVGIATALVVNSMTAAQRSATTGQITKNGHLGIFSLHAGDCFQNPSGTQPSTGLTQVTAVPCASPHNAQVIAQVPMPGSACRVPRAGAVGLQSPRRRRR